MAAVKGYSLKLGKKQIFRFDMSKTVLFIFLLLMVLFTSLPLIYVTSTSVKPLDELFIFPPRFFARNPTLSNFSDLFTALDSSVIPFTRYIFNSIFVSVFVVFFTVIISVMAAYGLVKLKPKGANFIFSLILVALMFSPHVTQIPNYIIIKSLGIINTYFALIIPKIAVAFNVFLMKQFIEQMPESYLEAARIDGATELAIFWKLVMPYVRPAWATLVVFTFVGTWNDYFSPLIFINDQSMKTIPLAIQNIAGGPGSASLSTAGAMAAATFVMTLPTVIVYTIMQSKVISTMSHAGIKA